MKTVEEITRRLLGRHLATIDDVTGVPGQAPAIVINWGDRESRDEFYYYDNSHEREAALSEARTTAGLYQKMYDVDDNTL